MTGIQGSAEGLCDVSRAQGHTAAVDRMGRQRGLGIAKDHNRIMASFRAVEPQESKPSPVQCTYQPRSGAHSQPCWTWYNVRLLGPA